MEKDSVSLLSKTNSSPFECIDWNLQIDNMKASKGYDSKYPILKTFA